MPSPTATNIWVLLHGVIDAENSRSLGRIVTVSSSPNALNLLDPLSRTCQSLTLNLPPLCVSVSPDGLTAVVGHNAWVSVVDLSSLTLLHTWPVPTSINDIILAGNGWCYTLPVSSGPVYHMELTTGLAVTNNLGYYAGAKGKCQPTEPALYVADNGLSPSEFDKDSIPPLGGPVTHLWDSPYHGDYPFSGDIWVSDDGTRLFARSRNVFTSSPVQATDLLYNGQLDGTRGLKWVEHSSTAAKILAIQFSSYSYSGETEPTLRVYDTGYLNYLGSLTLPGRPGTGDVYFETQGKFVFVNAAGDGVFVLGQAKPGSGILQDWSLIRYTLADLP